MWVLIELLFNLLSQMILYLPLSLQVSP